PKGDAANQVNNDAVYALMEDSRGHIWIGTNGGGVNILDPETGVIKKMVQDYNSRDGLSGDYVRAFCEDKEGAVWIGTTFGLCTYYPRSRKIIPFDPDFIKLHSTIIISLYADKADNIWIGTIGGGLSVYNKRSKKLATYTEADGLPDNTIKSIVEDDLGNIWLSTNNGISKFIPQRNKFKNYTLANG